MNSLSSAHSAIGRAVCASQDFETVLLVSFELLRMTTEPEYRAMTDGMIPSTKFKNPARNLLNTLSERIQISPDLASEINELIENRHCMIHRWIREHGFTEENYGDYEALAIKVEAASKRISLLLLSYTLKWAAPNPDIDQLERLNRMRQLFMQ